MKDLETAIKQLIIEALELEDISIEDIVTEEPLFDEGLGLDSIDALELSVIIDRQYGIKIKAEDERNAEIFSSLNALAAFISDNRTR